ncbi:ABC transporter permease [Actinomyces sp. MRS3W]|uniref:ABC transporter permease n=1 Tax=Actinomyces sp. MRS3W TaxID=2800796 RepID=UPI0028FD9480|nr:ABC transporter permease [Actinomyces sp. MRS3W]MDU0349619.1 ABC transporter permease [Actinomyces sp. MRS3W]
MTTTRPLPLAVLRAALRQAYSDLRPRFLGASVLTFCLPAAVVLFVGRLADKPGEGLGSTTAFGTMFAAGSIGAYVSMCVVQISSETYTDRIGGARLRVRILPHGPMTWAIGKTISVVIQAVVGAVIVLVGFMLVVDSISVSPRDVVVCLVLMLLAALASTPLGFLIGALIRGAYSFTLAYLGIMALWATSGFMYPLAAMPRWLQILQLPFPAYWSGHLARWALVGDPAWEVGGAFHPGLAVLVLVAWIVVGFALVAPIIRRSFRQETIGGLAHMRATLSSQSGM